MSVSFSLPISIYQPFPRTACLFIRLAHRTMKSRTNWLDVLGLCILSVLHDNPSTYDARFPSLF